MRRSVLFPILFAMFLISFLNIFLNYTIATSEFLHSPWIEIYRKNNWEFDNILQLYFNIYKYQWYFFLIVLGFIIDMIRRKNINLCYFSWYICITGLVNIIWFAFTIYAYYGVYLGFHML